MTQQHTTLHLLMASPIDKPQLLSNILNAWGTGDQLLLLADAVQYILQPTIQVFAAQLSALPQSTVKVSASQTFAPLNNTPFIFALEIDTILLHISSQTPLPDYIQIIGMDDWALLTHNHQRSLTWC